MENISYRWHLTSLACAAVACLQTFMVADRIKNLSSIVWELGFEPGLLTVSLSTTVIFFVTSAAFIILGLFATDRLKGMSLTFRLLSMLSVQLLVAGAIIWGSMLVSPYVDFVRE